MSCRARCRGRQPPNCTTHKSSEPGPGVETLTPSQRRIRTHFPNDASPLRLPFPASPRPRVPTRLSSSQAASSFLFHLYRPRLRPLALAHVKDDRDLGIRQQLAETVDHEPLIRLIQI